MNEQEVDRQINQMVQFIKQEAEEKANEIRVAAEEEFNIEKLQMVETEKQRIRKEYERKESQVEVKKKIEYSTELNAMRLKVLAAREEAIQGMLAEARATVGAVSASPAYAGLLVSLICQGVRKLEAKQAVVRCRAADAEKVKQAMQQAQTSMPGVALKLDEHEFLPAAPACNGGVHWGRPSPSTARSCATTRSTTGCRWRSSAARPRSGEPFSARTRTYTSRREMRGACLDTVAAARRRARGCGAPAKGATNRFVFTFFSSTDGKTRRGARLRSSRRLFVRTPSSSHRYVVPPPALRPLCVVTVFSSARSAAISSTTRGGLREAKTADLRV